MPKVVDACFGGGGGGGGARGGRSDPIPQQQFANIREKPVSPAIKGAVCSVAGAIVGTATGAVVAAATRSPNVGIVAGTIAGTTIAEACKAI